MREAFVVPHGGGRASKEGEHEATHGSSAGSRSSRVRRGSRHDVGGESVARRQRGDHRQDADRCRVHQGSGAGRDGGGRARPSRRRACREPRREAVRTAHGRGPQQGERRAEADRQQGGRDDSENARSEAQGDEGQAREALRS